MVACGEFASVRNLSLHSVEASSAERLVGGFGTLGAIQTLRRQGVTDQELGLTELREAARAHLGDDDVPIYVSYTLHIGVRTA